MNVSQSQSVDRNVAVIGAGVSGLVSAKSLLEEGLVPTVFEQTEEIAGIWNYHEERPFGGGPAYRALRTNTSKQLMAFSDYPFPDTLPDFPKRADVLQYLNSYADHFDLRPRIRLGTVVEKVAPTTSGQWEVTSRTGNQTTTEDYGAVVVCSGVYRQPIMPTYPGMESFQGKVLHSVSYKGPEPFAGQAVVLVGMGSSAAEIAVELSNVARQVVVSTIRGAWIIPKYIDGLPYDHRLTRLSGLVPMPIRLRLFRHLLIQEYRRMRPDHDPDCLDMPFPDFDLWRTRLTANTEFVPRVADGEIIVKPAIARMQAHEAIFADDSQAQADTILYCTGYAMKFPFLEDRIIPVTDNCVELYKHIFHPDLPNIAFVGLITVAGPLPPVAELQARVAARVFVGAVKLPSSGQMHEKIRERHARLRRRGAYPMRVQLLDYMDELARVIGAKPNSVHHWRLIPALLTGPLTAAQYRLDGPGRSFDAEAMIRHVRKHNATASST